MFVKKLSFAPLVLILSTLLSYQISLFFKSPTAILSLNLNLLSQTIILSALILLLGLSLTLFITFSSNFKIYTPIIIVMSFLVSIFLTFPYNIYLSLSFFIATLLFLLKLNHTLKTYTNFSAGIFIPSIKTFALLTTLSITLTFFGFTNTEIKKSGLTIPDSLIESVLKITMDSPDVKGVQITQAQPSLTKEQLDLLKQNPNLVKQYGLDPSILDTLVPQNQTSTFQNPQTSIQDNFIKQAVKSQLQNMLNPYLNFVPLILAALFFLSLTSLNSLLSLLLTPIITLKLTLLEKTGFIKFEKQMREIKKLVV